MATTPARPGQRTHLVPGQAYPDVTNIDDAYREQWSCTPDGAVEAGQRRSSV